MDVNVAGTETSSATLVCPQHHPSEDRSRFYRWFKQCGGTLYLSSLVAHYLYDENRYEANVTMRDLTGRAWLAKEDGRLTITRLQLSDKHCYSCVFDGKVLGYVHLDVTGEFLCIILNYGLKMTICLGGATSYIELSKTNYYIW